MLGLFRRRHSQRSRRERHAVPDGVRVYAIGDIHGCVVQLECLLALIDDDCRGSQSFKHLIFLGDLVDRGPDSAAVVERLANGALPGDRHSFLMGNHEEAMLSVWEGHGDVIAGWLRFGGMQTLESYGVSRAEVYNLGMDLPARMREVIPARHMDFIAAFEDHVTVGNYLFVHAGIKPGVPLQDQDQADLRWIREEFLSDDETNHGFRVVHGHTISDAPELRSNRIGIDTGCYKSGVLTALVLESDQQRFLATETSGDPVG